MLLQPEIGNVAFSRMQNTKYGKNLNSFFHCPFVEPQKCYDCSRDVLFRSIDGVTAKKENRVSKRETNWHREPR